MANLHGETGRKWLVDLPALIAAYADKWSLTVLPPFEPLSYNYVAPAIRAGGSEAVLKVGVPHPQLLTEIAALQIFGGDGIVQLLEADPTQGIFLVERLQPGTMLSTLSDDKQATSIAGQVMRQLWKPAPAEHNFPTVQKWAKGLERLRNHFDGGVGPFPHHLVETAEAFFAELIASLAEPVLLHGDLHHFNILAARRQPWLAIDPKGVVGEAAYEVGALLRNPMPHLFSEPDLTRILARRLDQLAEELEFDRARLWRWGVAQAVLSAWWDVEDKTNTWQEMLTLAEHLLAAK
jgi:streptomycin 6-kinase